MSNKIKCGLAWSLLISGVLTFPALAQIEIDRHKIDKNLDGGFWVYTTDFDQDGDPDILAASLRDGLKWYENDGSGSFTRQQIFDFQGAWSVHANDFDNDGDLDVVASSPDLDETAWFERKSNGNFVKHIIDEESLDPQSVFSADLDNDDDIDIVLAAWESQQVVLWENRGEDTFRRRVLDDDLSSAHSVYAADLDGDGDIEVLAGGGGKTAYWRNDGNLKFRKQQVGSRGAFSVYAADVNGDGRLDFLRNQRDTGDIDWFRNTATGFKEKIVSAGLGETWAIFSSDLDLDGDTDILTAGFVPNVVSAWLNNGDGSFTEQILDDELVRPRGISAADFDGDRDPDIVVVSRTDQLIWYEVLGSPEVPTLTMVQPNGGEIIEVSSAFELRWDFVGSIGSVNVEYSTEGVTWQPIVLNAPNTGGYDWLTPDIEADMLIRVSDTRNPSISDVTDSTFSLVRSKLKITAPVGGENWFSGATHEIRWTSAGPFDEVKLEYSLHDSTTNDSTTWETISAKAANSGSFSWLVPDVESANVRLRISDATDGSPSDMIDAPFSISQPTMTLTSPNGGEEWHASSTREIRWASTGIISQVKLEYSLNNGINWHTIADGLTNTGSYTWSVAETPSESALIRLSDSTDDTPSDLSDAVFRIVDNVTDVKIINDPETIPGRFQLFQNYPNPFNPATTIRFAVPHRAMVNLSVFNALGQPVATLVSQRIEPGEYKVVWLADQIPSGIYLYRMQAGQFSQTLRLTLLK